MAWTLGAGPVTNASGGAGTSLAVNLTGTTAGRSIIVGVMWNSTTSTITSITCTGESNLTLIGSPQRSAGGADKGIQLAYLANNTGGGSKTITVNLSGSGFLSIFAVEYAGGNIASLLDTSNSAAAASSNPSTSLTTTSNNSLIVSIVCSDSGVNSTPGSGFTAISVDDSNGATDAEYKLDAGTAGSKTVDYTNASTNNWVIYAAAFNTQDDNVTRAPGAGSLSVTGTAPTATLFNTSRVPTAATLVLTGNAPIISVSTVGETIVPAAVVLALSGAAPATTVSVSNTGITPTAGELALTGILPSQNLSEYGSGTMTAEFVTATGNLYVTELAYGAAAMERMSMVGYAPGYTNLVMQVMTMSGAMEQYGSGTMVIEPFAGTNYAGAAYIELFTMSGSGGVVLTETFRTFVMNTRSGGVTEFQNFPFNSYAKIGDKYYAAGVTGLYLLEGSSDNNVSINWRFRTGQLDDKTDALKRLPEVLMGLRMSGPVRVRVWYNDTSYADYVLPPVNTSSLYQHRVTPGRGMRSRYYAIELQGVANSAAEIDSLQPMFSKTTRRLG